MRIELAGPEVECEAELLGGLNARLHAMSQPLTALLCLLEYGTGLEGTEEMKLVISGGLEQCGRLMETVRTMQTLVVAATEREGAERTHWR